MNSLSKDFDIETKIREIILELSRPSLDKYNINQYQRVAESILLYQSLSQNLEEQARSFNRHLLQYQQSDLKIQVRLHELEQFHINSIRQIEQNIEKESKKNSQIESILMEIQMLKGEVKSISGISRTQVYSYSSLLLQEYQLERISQDVQNNQKRGLDQFSDLQQRMNRIMGEQLTKYAELRNDLNKTNEEIVYFKESFSRMNYQQDQLQGSIEQGKVQKDQLKRQISSINDILQNKADTTSMQEIQSKIRQKTQSEMDQIKMKLEDAKKQIDKISIELNAKIINLDSNEQHSRKWMKELSQNIDFVSSVNEEKIQSIQNFNFELQLSINQFNEELTSKIKELNQSFREFQTQQQNDEKENLKHEFENISVNLGEKIQSQVRQQIDPLRHEIIKELEYKIRILTQNIVKEQVSNQTNNPSQIQKSIEFVSPPDFIQSQSQIINEPLKKVTQRDVSIQISLYEDTFIIGKQKNTQNSIQSDKPENGHKNKPKFKKENQSQYQDQMSHDYIQTQIEKTVVENINEVFQTNSIIKDILQEIFEKEKASLIQNVQVEVKNQFTFFEQKYLRKQASLQQVSDQKKGYQGKNDDPEDQIKRKMIDSEFIDDVKADILILNEMRDEQDQKILKLEKVLQNIQFQSERDTANFLRFKSDIVNDTQYINNQISQLFKERNIANKKFQTITQLLAINTESLFIILSYLFFHEIVQRSTGEQQFFKFQSTKLGVIFEMKPGMTADQPLLYRNQKFTSQEILKKVFNYLIEVWNVHYESEILHEIKDYNPATIFKTMTKQDFLIRDLIKKTSKTPNVVQYQQQNANEDDEEPDQKKNFLDFRKTLDTSILVKNQQRTKANSVMSTQRERNSDNYRESNNMTVNKLVRYESIKKKKGKINLEIQS